MTYAVKWGRERLHFPLPPPDTKLAVIRQQLAEYTQLPANSFKLVHAGAVMKDDNAPISAYGIKEKSIIAIVGGGDNTIASKPVPERRTEESTIAQIRGELENVRQKLQPDVDDFLSTLDSTATSTAPPPQPAAKPTQRKGKDVKQSDLAQEHIRLGELLLQSLLRLDAIVAEGEWEEARRERKGAVREVQGLLDRLDGGWRARTKVYFVIKHYFDHEAFSCFNLSVASFYVMSPRLLKNAYNVKTDVLSVQRRNRLETSAELYSSTTPVHRVHIGSSMKTVDLADDVRPLPASSLLDYAEDVGAR
ncbi:hypothetical protein NM688_g192 [Phlebia brevispora]|uniref:Uncharacterized protein n=1 Tax=Phlebia brevispora TaxID=194682 RepID=A0ACC1TEW1_9APHY|nr:hypothetical protein NM688_g192 [Phlebia brevispora]